MAQEEPAPANEPTTTDASSAPRSEAAVFADLAALCSSAGYAHALAFLCFRDNIVRFSGELTADDLRNVYSDSRLIRTEIATLLGLMTKAPVDLSLPTPEILAAYIERTEALLDELHQIMAAPMFQSLQSAEGSEEASSAMGAALREPIFYGGESAYIFQYRDFASPKYSSDAAWLRSHRGFVIDDARCVAAAVAKIQDEKAEQVLRMMRGQQPEEWTFLSAFSFTADEVANRASLPVRLVEKILVAFATELGGRNASFNDLHDFNETNAYPLILVDGTFYLFHQYSLAEAIYETPFYWMLQDDKYKDEASKNRGEYTEQFARSRLSEVFGAENVHGNVELLSGRDRLGEIDTLVIFGDRLIILQAKSKRLTLEARRGNDQQIRSDFRKAIQDAYDQGWACADLVNQRKVDLLDGDGRSISLPSEISEIYIFCLVADHYPALQFQARQFLTVTTSDVIRPPFVGDVFTLDVAAEMLPSPLYFLSYLSRRVDYADRVLALHELTILAYHLRLNLWIGDDLSAIYLHDDVSGELDVAMAVRRDGLPGQRTPSGILTQIRGTRVGEIITAIENAPNPMLLNLGFLLLSLSEDAVQDISRAIDQIQSRTRCDGKNHDVTLGFEAPSTGLTIHCNREPDADAASSLHRHCFQRKYTQKAGGWFGLSLSPDDGSIRFGLELRGEWKHDAQMDALTAGMRRPSHLKDLLQDAKVGRNDPCPCGSGKKYKRCHLRSDQSS